MFEKWGRGAGFPSVPVDDGWPGRAVPEPPEWIPPWAESVPQPLPEWVPPLAEWGPSPTEAAEPASESPPSGWLALEIDQRTTDPAALSDAELIDGVVAFEQVASWAQARQARLLAEFARRRPADDPMASRSRVASRYSEFAPDEVGLALRLSRTAASARIADACTLAEELPTTLTAWEQGLLDASRVRAVLETVCVLPADLRPALEARVLPRAPEQTVAQLRAALARAVSAIDPAGAQERHQQRRTERRVVVTAEGDGMASLWALLPAPDATAVYQRLSQLARGLGAADPRGMDARRADLLTEVLTGARCAAAAVPTGAPSTTASRTGASVPTGSDASASARAATRTAVGGSVGADRHECRPSGPGRPLVHVTVPITMLMGLDEQPGELAGHGPIPAALARQIAAEGTWRRLLTDPVSGALLDHGRTTYTPQAALADFVRARDVHCRFPTCRQPAARADLDHTLAHADGGATSADNLHASCRHHHRAKTHGPGWRLTQHHDGRVTYTTPTGHHHTSEPHDYRLEPAPEWPPRSRSTGNAGTRHHVAAGPAATTLSGAKT